MFPLPGRYKIYLASGRRQSTGVLTPNSEKNQLSDVPEVEPNATAIWAAVLADFVPNQVAFVVESPGPQDIQSFGKQGIGYPQIEMAGLGGSV